jgi:hypothetical protein
MKKEYFFVSCDIVAHSAEPNVEKQTDRVAAINGIVATFISAHGGIVWASGGDGGHVAIPADKPPHVAIQLITELRAWSTQCDVPLRVSANQGLVECIEGADGRSQLVGHGINLAGHLIPFAGAARVVVSATLRDRMKDNLQDGYRFHDERMINAKSIGPELVCLLSCAGKFDSVWDDAPFTSDRTLLQRGLDLQDGLAAVYRARRLLEMNPSDPEALAALRTLTLERSWIENRNSFIESLFIEEEFGPQIIRAGSLMERRPGEILCELDDEGETMFWILRGKVGGLLTTKRDGFLNLHAADFVMNAGELAGELAFGLRRRRTATLYCLEDTAVLVFSYPQLIAACPQEETKRHVEEIVNRKITARAIENLWNTADYFRGMAKSGPLAKATAPWLDLIPFCKRTRLPSVTGMLPSGHPAFEQGSLCILIGGTLLPKGAGSSPLKGSEYPVLWVDLPGEIGKCFNDYELFEDVDLLTVRKEGLWKLGPAMHREILMRLRPHLSACSYLKGEAPCPASPRDSAKVPLEAKLNKPRFDVFLSHSSREKPVVRDIAEKLKARGLSVWLDEWELVPGRPWQEALEEIIHTASSAAVLVGADGLGPWETPEIRACLCEFVNRRLPVIPVLLPDALAQPELPLFLKQFTWVDLSSGITAKGLDRLEWGITGQKNTPPISDRKSNEETL